MSNAVNPYAAPAARVDDVPSDSAAEAVRRAHINPEASIKAVGLLYYLGGAMVALAGLAAFMGARGERSSAGVLAVLLVLGVAQLFAGWGVRALASWGRNLGAVLSAIGLLGFPIGTLVNGYILYLFFSKKGRTIFSPEYQDVVAATPHVKYRTSIVVWIFLALLVGLVALGIGAALFGK